MKPITWLVVNSQKVWMLVVAETQAQAFETAHKAHPLIFGGSSDKAIGQDSTAFAPYMLTMDRQSTFCGIFKYEPPAYKTGGSDGTAIKRADNSHVGYAYSDEHAQNIVRELNKLSEK